MPVETAAERIGMLLEFGFQVEYAAAGVFPGVFMQAIFDAPHELLLEPPLRVEISNVGPTLLMKTVDIPTLATGDRFRLGIAGVALGAHPGLYGVLDSHPATSDGFYTRVVLISIRVGIPGGTPGDPVIPT